MQEAEAGPAIAGDDDAYTEAGSSAFEKYGISDAAKELMVGNLMRLALFHDCCKAPLKKADIQAKVMGEHAKMRKLTNEVIAEAASRFRDAFGYDFVELTTVRRDKKGLVTNKNASTGLFVLVNRLDDDKDMLSWTPQSAQYGLLMVVLSLIHMCDGAIDETHLFTLLGSLGLSSRDLNHQEFGDWQALISKTFTKQYYIRRKQGEKKGTYEYVRGPRAKLEITKLQTLEFIANVFGDELDEIQRAEIADEDSDEEMED